MDIKLIPYSGVVEASAKAVAGEARAEAGAGLEHLGAYAQVLMYNFI